MNEVGAIFVTSAFAALIAIWGIISQRIVSRRLQTFQHFTKMDSDKDMIAARKTFIALTKQGNLAKFADAGQEQSDETNAIRLVLNNFELLAAGIQMGVVDEELYVLFNRDATLQFWKHAAPFVLALRARRNAPSLYHEFEELAKRLNDKAMPGRKRWGRLIY